MPGLIKQEDISSNVRDAEYAVRGAITNRAAEIEKELSNGKSDLPFDKVLYCNIGNPQQVGQKPISYPRQLLACCEYPELAEASGLFPSDVKERAKKLSQSLKPGAYSTSVGHQAARDAIAEGITARDGHKADPDLVFVTNGASGSVKFVLEMLITNEKDAFLVPVPQYPLYSAELTLQGGTMLPYYLDESANWAVNIDEVERALKQADKDGLNVKGMVVISPGNPTGQVLGADNQLDLLRLCQKNGLALMADEVYQENVWAEGKEFTSFRKVAIDNSIDDVIIFSMHSISKGFLGECGHRGGYMEIINANDDFIAVLKKLMSISLCANTPGQILTAAMMSPPKEGEESYKQYTEEKNGILASLKRRAEKLCSKLNELEGITCSESEGALYVFPRLHLPEAAHKAAKEKGQDPDFFYAMQLLENTGIVAIPGSGFKQAPGTFHLRITILVQEEHMDDLVDKLTKFHNEFMDKHKD